MSHSNHKPKLIVDTKKIKRQKSKDYLKETHQITRENNKRIKEQRRTINTNTIRKQLTE